MLASALAYPLERIGAMLRRIAMPRAAPASAPAEPPRFSRVPYTTGDPREDARNAAWAAEGYGVLPDADRVSEADLEGFAAYARQLREHG